MINVSLVRFLLLFLYLSTTAGLQCLSCQSVPDKSDCRRLVTCGANQICYANRVIDGTKTPVYNLGCEDQFACSQHSQSAVGKRGMDFAYSDFPLPNFGQKRTVQTTCFQCCNSTDGCNINACGTVTTINRRCYSCRDVANKENCEQIAECSIDEYCYVHEGINPSIAAYEIRYDFGCMGELQCNAFKLIYPTSCVACCNQTDLCNYDACDGWTLSLIRTLIILVHVTSAAALLCLSCKQVRDVRDCLTLEECGAHQKCYTNLVTNSHGINMYNLGCVDQYACGQHLQSAIGKRDTDFTHSGFTDSNADQKRSGAPACLQCCNNANGCNKNLCGAATSTNLRCMTCRDVLETKHCDKAIECGRDQFCFIQRAFDPFTKDRRYKMNCMGFQQCNGLDNSSPQDCATCCNSTDYCNYAACDNWSATHGKSTPTTVKTTPKLTTNTSHLTTSTHPLTSGTPPPHIHVLASGPHVSPYGSHVEITFIFMPQPHSYICRFNGTHPLPKGASLRESAGSLAGMAKIIIAELNELTFGDYGCTASINGRVVGKTHSIGIQKERPTAHISKSLVATHFALVCIVTGYPLPVIQWTFVPSSVGSPGIPPGVQYSTEPLKSTLSVEHYNPIYDNGVWHCRASNALGSAVASIYIH